MVQYRIDLALPVVYYADLTQTGVDAVVVVAFNTLAARRGRAVTHDTLRRTF